MVMVCCSSVNGRWVSAESGSSFPVLDPLTGSEVGQVPDMTAPDCQLAITAASQAFSSWQHTTAKERSGLLRKWYNLCVSHSEDLARLLTAEQGKPLAEATGEVVFAASFFHFFSEEVRRPEGELISASAAGKLLMVSKKLFEI